MTEENVTKKILAWLTANRWAIVCYDFPQSGTGVFLHPNDSTEKNKDTVNPDIVAVRGNTAVFFENKSYFYYQDYKKVEELRTSDRYSNAIDSLLKNYSVNTIYYGIGYPKEVHKKKAQNSVGMVDFVIGVEESGTIEILYSMPANIF